MINVITSTHSGFNSIRDKNDNFTICHCFEERMLPLANGEMGYHFKVYHQDGLDPMDEFGEYLDEPNFKYEFIPVSAITEALDLISETLMDQEVDLELDGEENDDRPDEIIVAIACRKIWNNQICRYLNGKFNENESELKSLDLYTYLRCTSVDAVCDLVKMQLNTEFIYPADPVAFSFALSKVLTGIVL